MITTLTTTWNRVQNEPFERFCTLESALSNGAEVVNHSGLSYLVKAKVNQGDYYIKIYTKAGKHLRRLFGRSRIRGEWENIFLFQSLGIATVPVITYGEECRWGMFIKGILVTEEISGAIDLQEISQKSNLLSDVFYRRQLLKKIAEITATLHNNKFIHNDLKWRNILISNASDPEVFLIDCPLGRKMFGPFLAHGVIKDLACLDKVGKSILSRTDRLRFYKHYRKISLLDDKDKQQISKVVSYFKGRE